MLSTLIVEAKTADEAFEKWFEIVKCNLESNSSRDGDVCFECLNAVTIIKDPTRCIMKNKIRNMSIRYALGEMIWYMSANKNLSEIQKYTASWDRMSDDGRTVNSNYGWCIRKKFGFDQWQVVKEELKENPDSRRAVIHIKTADERSFESKDMNCTCYLQFFIREGKLHLHTHMRSNDLWMGFPYDVFQFTCMQILMSMELGIELGEYVHIADSLHMYKRDYEVTLENERNIV